MICPSCALDLPAGARFCLRCGAALPAGPAPADEERKVVTVVFCDLVGSTELAGMLDPEVLRAVLLRYYELMRERVEARGGVVEKFIGDAVMAVFGLVAVREDDALRAAAAALDMVRALDELDDELRGRGGVGLAVRIGVHTGEVVTTADPATRQALVSGDVVNIAARLQGAAGRGQVLVSAAARRAAGASLEVAPVGPLTLKGVAEPVEAARLLAAGAPDRQSSRRFDAPFVGRERDLSALTLAWRRVVEEGDSHVLTLLGEAGVGKTRLVARWLERRQDEGPVGMGRCRAYNAAGSLGALADCMAPLVAEAENAGSGSVYGGLTAAIGLLRGGLLLDGTPSPSTDETCAAIAQVLAALAFERSVLLVIDDCHEADPALLGALDRLVGDLDRVSVMVLCAARPELLDVYPSWGSGRVNATTVMLGGLSRASSEALVAGLVDVVPHAEAVLERIVGQAGGNPLYLEQLAAAMGEDGGASADRLPPDLHALLAARIDRLGDGERMALRHAAVLEGEFDAPGLCGVAADVAAIDDCVGLLRSLARRRFLEPIRRAGAEQAYSFVNAAVQRVAYAGLTKRRRAELHERYAALLGERLSSDAQVGTHLARAYSYRSEVGPAEGLDALRLRAAERLHRAGAAALRRVDLPRALTLLDAAADLWQDSEPGLPQCLQLLGEALLTLGRLDEARETLRRAKDLADARGLAGTAAHAGLHLALALRDEPALEAAAGRALAVFEAEGDELGLARSRMVLAGSLQRLGRHTEALSALDLALAHARAAVADRELANTLGAMGLALWHGPHPAAEAAHRCEELLAEHGSGRRAVVATLGFPLTLLYAIQALPEPAEACRARTRRAMAALAYAEADVFGPLLDAMVSAAAGRLREAEALAVDALAASGRLRSDALALSVSLELARVRLALGDVEGAARATAGAHAGPDRPADRADLLGIRARTAAAREAVGEADRLAAEAVAVGAATDSPAALARARLDQAHTFAALGYTGRAAGAARAALRHYAAKGHAVGVAQARRFLEELAPR